MNIGMLRTNKIPGILARTVASFCKAYGVNFFYFTPKDIKINSETINGLFFEKGIWETREVPYPEIVDNEPLNSKTKWVFLEMQNSSLFIDNPLGSKDNLFNLILKDGRFSNLIIPYKKVVKISDITTLCNKYKKVLLKPVRGNQGRNIYSIEYKNDVNVYIIKTDKTEELMNYKEFESFIKNILYMRDYVCQKYIDSYIEKNGPFDIRLITRKNIFGKWEKNISCVRLGLNKNVTSNIANGGGIANTEAFIDVNFPESSMKIKNQLKIISKEFSLVIESFYKYPLDALGIDLGIDNQGKIWLFEVNRYPGVKYFYAEDAEARTKYYIYLLRERKFKNFKNNPN